jgi:replicative DNA helicase
MNLEQTERTFVGCLLREPRKLATVAHVTPEMLRNGVYREIYGAMRGLFEADRPITSPALRTRLPTDFEDVGPAAAVLSVLRTDAEGAGDAEDYAPLILDNATRIALEGLADWSKQETRKPGANIEEIAGEASLRLERALETASPLRRENLGTAAARAVERFRAPQEEGRTSARGITTGLPGLDAIVGNIYGLTFLIANQGEGKSALAAQIATHCGNLGLPVLIFQFEMDAEEMGVRALASATEIDAAVISASQADLLSETKSRGGIAVLKSQPVFVVDSDRMNVRQIGAQCRAFRSEHGSLALVVIDQLDKVEPDRGLKDPYERRSSITRELKALSKAMPETAFLVLGQRTRKAQRSDDPVPEINDADYPSIERDGDIVLAAWFPANWLRRHKPKKSAEEMDAHEAEMRKLEGRASIITLKHRRRKAFLQRDFRFNGPLSRFEELEQ